MTPRIRMAIANWKTAMDGSAWSQISAAWMVLHALVMAAAQKDREERS